MQNFTFNPERTTPMIDGRRYTAQDILNSAYIRPVDLAEGTLLAYASDNGKTPVIRIMRIVAVQPEVLTYHTVWSEHGVEKQRVRRSGNILLDTLHKHNNYAVFTGDMVRDDQMEEYLSRFRPEIRTVRVVDPKPVAYDPEVTEEMVRIVKGLSSQNAELCARVARMEAAMGEVRFRLDGIGDSVSRTNAGVSRLGETVNALRLTLDAAVVMIRQLADVWK